MSEPYPLLDPGEYTARCSEATFAWARQWGAWKVRLVLDLLDYRGRPYQGKLCKFLNLGKNPDAPYAGPRSDFRSLWVELNGEQPTRSDVDMTMFEKRLYRITVETVTKNRKNEPLAPVHWYSIVRVIHPAAPSTPFNSQDSENSRNQITEQPSNLVNPPLSKKNIAKESEQQRNKFG